MSLHIVSCLMQQYQYQVNIAALFGALNVFFKGVRTFSYKRSDLR